MASRIKDTIGISLKEKGRKRLIKPLVKSSEALEDKGDSFKCKKRPWSEEEDLLVIKLVKEHGPQKWTFIATHLEGRIGKQCRERQIQFIISKKFYCILLLPSRSKQASIQEEGEKRSSSSKWKQKKRVERLEIYKDFVDQKQFLNDFQQPKKEIKN